MRQFKQTPGLWSCAAHAPEATAWASPRATDGNMARARWEALGPLTTLGDGLCVSSEGPVANLVQQTSWLPREPFPPKTTACLLTALPPLSTNPNPEPQQNCWITRGLGWVLRSPCDPGPAVKSPTWLVLNLDFPSVDETQFPHL